MKSKRSSDVVIGIMGNVASGKTTLARRLGESLHINVAIEYPEKCVYLNLFYQDPQRWAFQSKMWFLQHHIHNYLNVKVVGSSGIVDGTIWDDLAHARVSLHGTDRELYDAWHVLAQRLVHYDLIIYLQAPAPVLLKRIYDRARDAEMASDLQSYIQQLDSVYANLSTILRTKYRFIVVNSTEIDLRDQKVVDALAIEIKELLSR